MTQLRHSRGRAGAIATRVRMRFGARAVIVLPLLGVMLVCCDLGRAAFPGLNGAIAVPAAGGSYAVTPSRHLARRLALAGTGSVDRLVWSRDGKRLLVSTNTRVFVADARGRRVPRTPVLDVGDAGAAWSRVGDAMIYSRATKHCRRALLIYRLADRSTTQITPCDGAKLPAVSPARGLVAYVAADGQVRLLDLLTGEIQTLLQHTDGEPATGPGDDGPAFSPTGNELAFSTGRTLAAYNILTKKIRTIIPAASDENVGIGSAAWSPDGKQIAFVRFDPPGPNGDNETHLYLVAADGSAPPTAVFGLDVKHPDWQPLRR